MKNLITGILEEMERCQGLLAAYNEIGPSGRFAAAMTRIAIDEGADAMASGDTVRMVAALKSLKGCQ